MGRCNADGSIEHDEHDGSPLKEINHVSNVDPAKTMQKDVSFKNQMDKKEGEDFSSLSKLSRFDGFISTKLILQTPLFCFNDLKPI